MQTRDVYAGVETTQIIDDYGTTIRNARSAKGMELEQFAALISEKKGTIAKVEANDLVPDDKLMKKIEKALGIKLMEAVVSGSSIGGGQSGNRMTLSNFIKKE
jgi:putative transcription factor